MKRPTKSEWSEHCKYVQNQMIQHVQKFVTPISNVIKDETKNEEHGEHQGSGTFIEFNAGKYLITNEHVAKSIKINSLAHQFYKSDSVIRISNGFAVIEYPIDLAIVRINENAWNASNHKSSTVTIDRFMDYHEPVKGEMLFMIGYSEERSRFLFNTLVNPGTPYLTQEKEISEDVGNKKYHFAIHYEPEKAVNFESNYRGLPKPPGFSGSLVWNTRYVEYNQLGKKWNPNNAEVTGMIFSWDPDSTSLLATKVEFLPIKKLCHRANEL